MEHSIKEKAKNWISDIREKGASYCDTRIFFLEEQQHFSTLNGTLDNQSQSKNQGFGVRVLYDGAWGFSSAEDFKQLDKTFNQAYNNAKAASKLISNKIELAPKTICQDTYISPCKIDPFSIPIKEKIDFFLDLDNQLKHNKLTYRITSGAFYKRNALYLDSEGSELEQTKIDVDGRLIIFAMDNDNKQQRRSFSLYNIPGHTTGWETIINPVLFSNHTARIVDELLQVCAAPECPEDNCDVILLNEMMGLQVHEVIGHPLELDRILGYELSYAGGSHVKLHHFDKLQYGSEKLTARADATLAGSPGSFGYDDDGVPAKNTVLIDKGRLVNAITSRQTIMEANKKAGKTMFSESGGTNRATSYNRLPIERMTNINIDPGNDGNLQDIISDSEKAILVDTPQSWSIGSNRENFHFATEVGWLVKNGKIDKMVKNSSYKGDTIKFWNSLDKVGNQDTLQLQLVFNCGKGQPNQIMRLGHCIPVCRFKNVDIGKSK